MVFVLATAINLIIIGVSISSVVIVGLPQSNNCSLWRKMLTLFQGHPPGDLRAMLQRLGSALQPL